MEKINRLGRGELIFVVTNSIICKFLLVYPAFFFIRGATGACLLCLLVILLYCGVFWLTNQLYKKFEGRGLVDIVEQQFGKRWGNVMRVVFIVLIALYASSYLVMITQNISTSILPNAGRLYLSAFFMAAATFACYVGLKAIIRTHAIVVPVVLGAALLLFTSNIAKYNVNNLFPLLGPGWPLLLAAPGLTAVFADVLVLLILIPYAKKGGTFARVGWPAVIISSAMLFALVGSYLLAAPYHSGEQYYQPLFRLAQYIKDSALVPRLEALFSTVWFFSFFCQMSLMLYLMCMFLSQLCGAKTIRPGILPMALVILLGSYVPQTVYELILGLRTQRPFGMYAGVVGPVVVLAMARLKARGRAG